MSALGQPQRPAFPQRAAITVLPLSFTVVYYSHHIKRVSVLHWRSICLFSERMTLAALELTVAQASVLSLRLIPLSPVLSVVLPRFDLF